MAPRCTHYTGAIDAFLSTMPSSSTLVAVLRDLESQWPEILGDDASEFQSQLTPLLAADPADEKAILALLANYPAAQAALQQLADQEASQEFADLGVLITRNDAFKSLPGKSITVVSGQRYICPDPDCSEEWYRQGMRTPPICGEHGKVLIPAPNEG